MFDLSANPDYKNYKLKTTVTADNPYYDICFDDMDNVTEVYGEDAINQAIEVVLTTEPYERLFNEELYSPLYFLFFENEQNVEDIIHKCFDKIEQWVPVFILRDQADINISTNTHSVIFRIPWVTTDGKYKGNFNRKISQ